MASGSFYKNITSSGYRLVVEWSSTPNVSTNKSTVRVTAKLKIPYDLYISGRTDNYITINGTKHYYDTSAISKSSAATVTLGTATATVSHNADGKKSITIAAMFKLNATVSGTYYGTVSVSKSVALDTIPRKATVTSAPNFNDEANPTIKYSNKAGTAVTSLEACISLDGSKDDVPYRSISKTGSSYTFELTDAERETLRNACTTATSRTVRFYVRTVLGGVTYTHYLSKTLSIVNAAPTLTASVSNANEDALPLTGDDNVFIRGYSDAEYGMTAAALKGATIASMKAVCGSVSNAAPVGKLADVDSGTFVFTATDSRGLTATVTIEKPFVDYFAPTVKMAAKNPTADGDMPLTVKGTWFNGSFGAASNTLAVQYRYAENDGAFCDWIDLAVTPSGNDYSHTEQLTGLDYRTKYTFQARVVDALNTAESNTQSVRAMPLFDWGENDFCFNVPVKAVYNPKSAQQLQFVAENGEANTDTGFQAVRADTGTDVFFGVGTGGINHGAWSATRGKWLFHSDAEQTYVDGFAFGVNKVLWSGAGWYMSSGQTVTLAEAISAQPHGIVLVWSYYGDGAAQNYNWHYHFVPKAHTGTVHNGGGTDLAGGNQSGNIAFNKYLYIHDTKLVGHDNNKNTMTGSVLTLANASFVLRYVIGV